MNSLMWKFHMTLLYIDFHHWLDTLVDHILGSTFLINGKHQHVMSCEIFTRDYSFPRLGQLYTMQSHSSYKKICIIEFMYTRGGEKRSFTNCILLKKIKE